MKGIALIEIIVGVAILAASFLTLGAIAQLTLRLADVGTDRLQAVLLISESMEAVRTMRDRGWAANIAPLGTSSAYYLLFDVAAGEWSATTALQTVDGRFARTVAFGDARRDANDDIAASGGAVDANTRRVVVTVAWNNRGRAYEESISTYITDLFNN